MNDEFCFTAPGRDLYEENRLKLTSVGVDIGSSTTLLVFSRIELEREDSRYVPVKRTILYESEILLTPYIDGTAIDGSALGRFIDGQYAKSGLTREEIDTGALILTGVALLRENARTVGELFSGEAGRFVAVSAGDNLETTMAAYGSGAVARSAETGRDIMNIDIGGGTTKIAVCSGGRIVDLAAVDIGARLVVWDENGMIVRLEEAGRRIGRAVGLDLVSGGPIREQERAAMAAYMAERLCESIGILTMTEQAAALMRTPPLSHTDGIGKFAFSGGVAEFIYGRQDRQFSDLGFLLAREIRERFSRKGLEVLPPAAGIRATVIGASQYVVQVSGSTIFISPLNAVPIRNIPVVAPDFALDGDAIDQQDIGARLRDALRRFDLQDVQSPVAIAFSWEGSATYHRINAFCHGVVEGMRDSLDAGRPLVLVNDGDVGGLFGIHLKEEMAVAHPVISIDGVDLREFDFIDIGSLIATSGAVPVVIKSLMFSMDAKK